MAIKSHFHLSVPLRQLVDEISLVQMSLLWNAWIMFHMATLYPWLLTVVLLLLSHFLTISGYWGLEPLRNREAELFNDDWPLLFSIWQALVGIFQVNSSSQDRVAPQTGINYNIDSPWLQWPPIINMFPSDKCLFVHLYANSVLSVRG